ncbi:nucleotide pyrophosphatase/phosphodiesterase family protein [Terasakiella sp. SH-1]|uniref:alkaline phosphatase family protein n=1 Tax=Terasakiella sp. SH-1 TaxID=2560057 RepID=UPI0010741D1D|nr:nucleotide pyrophosphatase/phosphodiesterase family protein [Terasakiella sp. SH-1]
MQPTLVLNVVGLTPAMIGAASPNLKRLAENGKKLSLQTINPAVTCSVQSTFLTGLSPQDHGIVANGWYFRELNEVRFWLQPNRLVQGEKLWHLAKKKNPDFTVANLFWWYNMATDADIAVTPRPMYPADGRKIPDIHAQPLSLRKELNDRFGTFPLFNFWGPTSSIKSSQWIGDCARYINDQYNPTLNLVYLPHLDYVLQQTGPDSKETLAELRKIDKVCGELIEQAQNDGRHVIVLSEYGVSAVDQPIHINRALRDAGMIEVREELGRELLDTYASHAFAVSDHQIAHIYIRDPKNIEKVKTIISALDGVEHVFAPQQEKEFGLAHERSGELVALASKNAWFTYYYWQHDEKAPDFARTVDIHRKPGYDPAELFLDQKITFPKLKLVWLLLRKNLGFRGLMDVIGLDASLVKGSHGRADMPKDKGAIFMTSAPDLVEGQEIHASQIRDVILKHIFPS